MAKFDKAPAAKPPANGAPNGATIVRNPKTGQSVTVKGVGALKGADLKLKKGLSLLKPIAEQALMRRSEKRKAAKQPFDKRMAG